MHRYFVIELLITANPFPIAQLPRLTIALPLAHDELQTYLTRFAARLSFEVAPWPVIGPKRPPCAYCALSVVKGLMTAEGGEAVDRE